MQSKPYQIYAVNAQVSKGREQAQAVILVNAQTVEIAQNAIRVYQQKMEMQLHYRLLPLPLELYFQRHSEFELIDPITTQSQILSEPNQVLIFYPDQYHTHDNVEYNCLTKSQVRLRDPDEPPSPFLFSPVPNSVKPFLWQGDETSKCYVLINAQSSFLFPERFNRNDLNFACLFKGEEAERRRTTAPYIIQLPEEHHFCEELFSEPPIDKIGEDTFQHWYKNFGFFFRSKASLDELVSHFKRFIYMNTYDGHQLYFRFYDAIVLEEYFDRLITYPKKLATFWGGDLIDSFLLPKGEYFVYYEPSVNLVDYPKAKKQFDKFEMQDFINARNKKLYAQMIDNIITTAPFLLEHYNLQEIEHIVQYHDKISANYNIKQSLTIGFCCLAALYYGKPIDRLDSVVSSVLSANFLNDIQKMYYIRQRIELLESQGVLINIFKEKNKE